MEIFKHLLSDIFSPSQGRTKAQSILFGRSDVVAVRVVIDKSIEYKV